MNWDEWIRPDDCVVDVGANVGEYTKEFVKRTDHVIAFEPNASVASKCRAVAPKADVRVMAVGESDGETTMYLTEQQHTQGSRYRENNRKGAPVTVPMTTLDTALHGLTVNGIKVDAQGGDGWVLVGAQETMSRMPKGSWLIFELWPEGMRHAEFRHGPIDAPVPWMVRGGEWQGLSALQPDVGGDCDRPVGVDEWASYECVSQEELDGEL